MKVKTKSKKVNKAWLNDHINDPYVKMAKKDGYRARAAYKLKEMDELLTLFKPGQWVVDLGAVPGAWSQYLRRRLMGPVNAMPEGMESRIIAVDLLEFEPVEGVQFIQGDFREQEVHTALKSALGGRLVDAVVSDMAPNLSGIEISDAARMEHLIEVAIEFAQCHMQPQGTLIVKAFHGSGYSQLVELFKANFRVVKKCKPKASRSKSSETFLIGIGLKKTLVPADNGG